MIHKTAIISTTAQLADDVKVGAYTIIEKDVSIGAGTEIKAHVTISKHTDIGENNRIFQFSSIGEEPQDKKYNNEPTRTIIGNNNTIREYVTINRGTVDDKGITKVGNNNWIMAYVHIAHDCIIGNDIIIANGTTLGGHVHLEDYVILGGFTKLHQFCRIGTHAFTAMDTGFQKDLPPYIMAQGNPAKPRAINTEGLKRRGFTQADIGAIKKAFKLLYKSDLRLAEALIEIQKLADTHLTVQTMIDFIKASNRSIVR
ncbi:Acyl-[acyl-carrier-protein]--UDP-N-acetylglucosamine O-acyltransferase [hydrothermal vent metagenome]|uniref:Acyl-[acyl-carrier-protein]--UDP-N-acetylglucosamine O-acyltransferase n=1 Tax=hydrothermal vent metagenome TaxID=652676 RepID=A0A3B0UU11_9ZZZZ